MARVLIADDEEGARSFLGGALEDDHPVEAQGPASGRCVTVRLREA